MRVKDTPRTQTASAESSGDVDGESGVVIEELGVVDEDDGRA